ncbi:hypothetical protein SAMN05444000_11530 [Shimia gijangensis]|uniref:Uncharacterized protein n=1 Tax=Shimia gijangensis TaxID=1470563 RepID=A0A1M6N3J8_9RHOB|nr:hypothetical protein [Shimia gijangensis]SHJ90246.1 hypothetical protein SAMN05444000_11530 [Shimia gijangensis]
MTNIVQLNVPSRRQPASERHGALMHSFASFRRFGDDVFWLKENAELLNILECTGAQVDDDALTAFAGFYDKVENRLQFFPQYYRFLLSICLDLEDLGIPGDKGAALVKWVADQGFAQAELSDLQRLEARRLMARRGVDPLAGDTGLEDRMRSFIARSATFSMPNKKAAYELTHAVFYLSEYGRKDPMLDAETRTSLEFTGLLAFIEQNADLLAEICIALRFGGFDVPEVWETWLLRHTHRFDVQTDQKTTPNDDYHEFLVCNWMLSVTGHQPFAKTLKSERMAFFRPDGVSGPLRELSECMFKLTDRSDDWETMRPVVLDHLSEDAQAVMSWAETSSDKFSAFFQGFARTGRALAVM